MNRITETFDIESQCKENPTGDMEPLYISLLVTVSLNPNESGKRKPTNNLSSMMNKDISKGIIKFCNISVSASSRGKTAVSEEAIWWYTGDLDSAISASRDFIGTTLGLALIDSAINNLSRNLFGCSITQQKELNFLQQLESAAIDWPKIIS